eukprot:scaffold176759_cov62-Attheya_sp.AAC.2
MHGPRGCENLLSPVALRRCMDAFEIWHGERFPRLVAYLIHRTIGCVATIGLGWWLLPATQREV